MNFPILRNMKYGLTLFTLLFVSISSIAQTYHFNRFAKVNGCSNVILQKISKDLRYELIVELKLDSLPKFKELNINEYSKFVTVYLYKYPTDNKYITDVCNDIIFYDPKARKPVKYIAIEGVVEISYWDSKASIISVILKNVTIKSKRNESLQMSQESFEMLQVRWEGG